MTACSADPDNDRIYGDDVTIALGGNGRYDASDAVSFVPSADPTTYGDDVADGGTGLDEIHGQDGGDELWGAEDHDQIFGELGSDDLHGEGGPDYLVGDRGTITPGPRDVVAPAGGWVPGTPKGSPVLTVTLVAPNDGSQDFIWGDFDSAGRPLVDRWATTTPGVAPVTTSCAAARPTTRWRATAARTRCSASTRTPTTTATVRTT